MSKIQSHIDAAELLLPCSELNPVLEFFTHRLGFRVDNIFPADDPITATVSAYGLRICFKKGLSAPPGIIRLRCKKTSALLAEAAELTAPNGTVIEIIESSSALVMPPERPSFVMTKFDDSASWISGRAGMLYRDLIPDRQGGRFIASHIRIEDAGPVPDYVHFHKVRFQMIYCYKGWVRVVYEDQGPSFLMNAGDCVLQAPEIRHRVLESSAALEVIEITSPGDHETWADHDLKLPTERVIEDRLFNGQRFVFHQSKWAPWLPGPISGFESRELGIKAASHGLATAQVIRPASAHDMSPSQHAGELLFVFLLAGEMTLSCDGHGQTAMSRGDSCVVPAALSYAIRDCSTEAEFLQVTLP
jgi:quercetin dioxygenase-like cupin family protein